MTPADSLLLDAKQAILDEQHRRFQILHRQALRQEALQQLQVTVACAADLLSESLRLLEDTLKRYGQVPDRAGPSAPN
ncbi:MAG: hypothetical protein GDA67_02335 [Nitrospira sp. CR1.3]|nr:hypothetical protein [Nitrospira sp. CR1.3]